MRPARQAAPVAAAVLAVLAIAWQSRADDAGGQALRDAGDGTPDGGVSGASAADTDAASPDAEAIWASCMEHVPSGVARPAIEERFPERGLSGYALELHVVVKHGRGETVLPNGFHVQGDSDAARAIQGAGFVIPAADGGAAPSMQRREDGQSAVTELSIPFVALPPKGGRHALTLPPVPIAISRASGELMTLCTAPHVVTVDDPTANEAEASPKGNPEPRPQRELWTLARDLTYGGLVGAAAAALLTWLVLRWLRRPRPAPPPPPPRPPWEIALEEIAALRRSDLLVSGRIADHVDLVSDMTRRYLGALYDFDGIESTTDEALAALAAVRPPLAQLDRIRALLGDCDLVKFARWLPTSDDCITMLDSAERIVLETMPHAQPKTAEAPPADPTTPPQAPQESAP